MNTQPKAKAFRVFWRERLVSGCRIYPETDRTRAHCWGWCRIEAVDKERAAQIFNETFKNAKVLKVEPTK